MFAYKLGEDLQIYGVFAGETEPRLSTVKKPTFDMQKLNERDSRTQERILNSRRRADAVEELTIDSYARAMVESCIPKELRFLINCFRAQEGSLPPSEMKKLEDRLGKDVQVFDNGFKFTLLDRTGFEAIYDTQWSGREFEYRIPEGFSGYLFTVGEVQALEFCKSRYFEGIEEMFSEASRMPWLSFEYLMQNFDFMRQIKGNYSKGFYKKPREIECSIISKPGIRRRDDGKTPMPESLKKIGLHELLKKG
ncbi:MAG: hypothetical protein ACE5FT_02570 [Candidatus Nanoarchaeia archaeon]